MDAHANFAYSAVVAPPSSGGSTLTIQSGDALYFPIPPFNATVWQANTMPLWGNATIIRVTAISGDRFTFERAQESSNDREIQFFDQIAATITKKTLTDIESLLGGGSYTTVGTDTGDQVVDGTSDQIEINAAIDALQFTGGTVLIKKGIYYNTAPILIRDNVTVLGEGPGTKLYLVSGSNCRQITNYNASGNSNIRVTNMQIDGNGANQTASSYDNLYFIQSQNVTVDNCLILNGNRHNILVSDSCTEIKVTNNRLKDAQGLSNCSTFNVSDMIFSNNISSGATQTGIKTDQSHTVTISNNVCLNNSTHQIFVTNGTSTTISGNAVRGGQNGVRVTSNDYVTINGNSMRSHSQDGIVFLQNCNYGTVSGNTIRDVGTAAANTYDGVNINDQGTGCTNITIDGNVIRDSASNMRYGVCSLGNSDYVTYGVNDVSGYVTGEKSLVGSNNRTVAYV